MPSGTTSTTALTASTIGSSRYSSSLSRLARRLGTCTSILQPREHDSRGRSSKSVLKRDLDLSLGITHHDDDAGSRSKAAVFSKASLSPPYWGLTSRRQRTTADKLDKTIETIAEYPLSSACTSSAFAPSRLSLPPSAAPPASSQSSMIDTGSNQTQDFSGSALAAGEEAGSTISAIAGCSESSNFPNEDFLQPGFPQRSLSLRPRQRSIETRPSNYPKPTAYFTKSQTRRSRFSDLSPSTWGSEPDLLFHPPRPDGKPGARTEGWDERIERMKSNGEIAPEPGLSGLSVSTSVWVCNTISTNAEEVGIRNGSSHTRFEVQEQDAARQDIGRVMHRPSIDTTFAVNFGALALQLRNDGDTQVSDNSDNEPKPDDDERRQEGRHIFDGGDGEIDGSPRSAIPSISSILDRREDTLQPDANSVTRGPKTTNSQPSCSSSIIRADSLVRVDGLRESILNDPLLSSWINSYRQDISQAYSIESIPKSNPEPRSDSLRSSKSTQAGEQQYSYAPRDEMRGAAFQVKQNHFHTIPDVDLTLTFKDSSQSKANSNDQPGYSETDNGSRERSVKLMTDVTVMMSDDYSGLVHHRDHS
ncbi:hypothetical protein I316_01206 [Kwoniella heveanensis BCC8398]|uniref:Uncharacterized protein n=1 Tax=Kwoniella heveanensis BCC8398 TaxID=1296120 RepID=A0A1B9H247_9TREE|nr:hypothetical protein I316_01206 [Kwoniella heveanensis BCC8398]